jgi:hypothetical protein
MRFMVSLLTVKLANVKPAGEVSFWKRPRSKEGMPVTMNISTLAVLAALVLLLTGLGFTVWIDPYVRKSDRRTMLVVIGLCCSLIVQNLWEYQLAVGRWNLPLRVALSIYGYSVRPVILILVLYIIRQDGKK